jgi:hypothetical protein
MEKYKIYLFFLVNPNNACHTHLRTGPRSVFLLFSSTVNLNDLNKVPVGEN